MFTTVCTNWSFPPRLHLCSSLCGEIGLQHLLNPPGRERGCRELRPALSYIPRIWACHTIPSVASPRPSSFPRMYALYAFNSQWMSLNVAPSRHHGFPRLLCSWTFASDEPWGWPGGLLHCIVRQKRSRWYFRRAWQRWSSGDERSKNETSARKTKWGVQLLEVVQDDPLAKKHVLLAGINFDVSRCLFILVVKCFRILYSFFLL